MDKPVILIAFAEYSRQSNSFLRELGREQLGIKNAMDEAVDKGLCEYEIIPDANPEEIVKSVQKHGERLVAFHFAGHADGYQLMVEAEEGEGTTNIYSEGFSRFLAATAPNLKLVFLNACATRGQVDDFLEQGIPLVMATSQAIEDRVARQFAVHFYTRLAKGSTIRMAYESFGHLHAIQRTPLRSLYLLGQENLDAFPWELYPKAGAEKARDWSLPKATNNCLFFLPELPADIRLPRHPYKGIQSYGREDAGVFWGRSCMIKDLYDEVTTVNIKSSPMMLFYGSSGVGKSSLLRAGLLPRIEGKYDVLYAARNRASSLAHQLQAYLSVDKPEQVARAWARKEEAAGKPLLIFLDQVEEVYTEPGPDKVEEMREFGKLIQKVFSGPDKIRIRGKVILSFREEYLARVEDDLTHEIPFLIRKFFVRRLSRNEIIEVIEGPKNEYRLAVDRELSIRIADDLTEDETSAIAPVLQILLNKMWEEARESDPPVFTQELYQNLKKEGQLLDYFVQEQLSELRTWNDQAVDSGLIHDLLFFHTTEIGTSRMHDFEALLQRYAHHSREYLAELLAVMRRKYLLNTSGGAAADPAAVRLTHDILAPLVRREYNNSIRPGQTAAKLVRSKMEAGKEKIPFNDTELKIIDEGRIGMRALTTDEVTFINECFARNQQLQRNRRILTGTLFGVLLVLFAVSGFFYKQNRDARYKRVFQEGRSIEAVDPTRAMKLKSEAWASLRNDFLLREELNATYRNNVFYTESARYPERDTGIRLAVLSPGGEFLAQTDFTDNEYQVFLFRREPGGHYEEQPTLSGPASTIYDLTFTADRRSLLGVGADHRLHRWELGNNLRSETFSLPDAFQQNRLESVGFNAEQNILAAGDNASRVFIWKATQAGQPPYRVLQVPHASAVDLLSLHPSDSLLLAGNEDGVGLYTFAGIELVSATTFGYADVQDVSFSGDGAQMLIADGRTANLWRVEDDTASFVATFDHADPVEYAHFTKDGKLTVTITGRQVHVWSNFKSDAPLRTLIGHQSPVLSAEMDDERKFLWSVADDGGILKWDFPYDIPMVKQPAGDRLTCLAVGPEEDFLLAAGRRGIQIRRLPDFEDVGVFQLHRGRIKALEIAEERSYAISADRDGAVLLWDIADQELIDSIQTGFDINALSITPDASRVLIATTDSVALLWRVNGNEEQRLIELAGHRAEIKAAHLGTDPSFGLTAGFDSLAIIWDLEKGEVKDTFQAQDYVFGVHFTGGKDNNFVAVTRSGEVVLRTLEGQILKRQVLPDQVNQVQWAPDGSYSAVLSIEGQVFLYDNAGKLIRRYYSESPLRGLDLSSTGEMIYGFNRLGELVGLRNDRPPLEGVLEIFRGKH